MVARNVNDALIRGAAMFLVLLAAFLHCRRPVCAVAAGGGRGELLAIGCPVCHPAQHETYLPLRISCLLLLLAPALLQVHKCTTKFGHALAAIYVCTVLA